MANINKSSINSLTKKNRKKSVGDKECKKPIHLESHTKMLFEAARRDIQVAQLCENLKE